MLERRPARVGFLLFDGVTALDLVGPAEAFAVARRAPGDAAPAYEVITVGLSRRRCVAESGLALEPARTLADCPPLDTVVVPGGHGLRAPRVLARVAAWIAGGAAGARRVASVCTGIYGLAASGLLDGRRVATHWSFVDDVARRFPALRVDPDALYLRDGKFYTSAGVTAGIDLSLALIEEDLGAAAALAVARELVVYMRRAGGQAQFSEPLRFQASAPDRASDLVAYIAGHLDGDLSVEALARRAGVSPRQLTRQCNEALGCSPAALVRRLRLDEARARLLRRATSVGLVAASLGFGSPDAFRRAFEARFGVGPAAYRARFLRARAVAGPA